IFRLLLTQTRAKLSRMVGTSAIGLVSNDLTTDKQNVSSPRTKSYHFEDYRAVVTAGVKLTQVPFET
ncbi:MAG: hypothetical protein ACKPAC_05560, partial [Alphaproteobacteria bacterium]